MSYLTKKRLKALICQGLVLLFRGKKSQGVGLISKMIITLIERSKK